MEHDNHSQSEKDCSCASPINCQRLANIIGGEVITSTPVCVVQRLRDIKATILGRTTRSPLALPFALSFEGMLANTEPWRICCTSGRN
ncbi:hypothetical protein [Lysinibacillus xylanilyticus]|uniref:hypothetical protein n=1 Tax=Lysinibacillus xylanilyticus TaxID=582475 RepID=UPI001E33FC9B|nr:hypothetical protein [Lysinibacillus xylanilyticus]